MPARIISSGTLIYMDPSGKTTTLYSNRSRVLESDEQPYIRQVKLSDKWVKVDLGWLKDQHVSSLAIKNTSELTARLGQGMADPKKIIEASIAQAVKEGKLPPSSLKAKSEEAAELLTHLPQKSIVTTKPTVLELYYGFSDLRIPSTELPDILPLLLIHPGETIVLSPSQPDSLYIRCREGDGTATVMVTP